MSKKFRKLLAMVMAEGIDFSLVQGSEGFYYLVFLEGETVIWELDDGETNVYLYDYKNHRHVYHTAMIEEYIKMIKITVAHYALDVLRSV